MFCAYTRPRYQVSVYRTIGPLVCYFCVFLLMEGGGVRGPHRLDYWYRLRHLMALRLHYENTPMQYTAIFHGCKIGNFQMKNCDIFLFWLKTLVHVRTDSMRIF